MSKLFKELKDMREAYELKLKNHGEAALKEAFKEIFEKYPQIKSIIWTQYTPYFNDGDSCVFGVNDFDVYIEGTNPTDQDEDDEEDDYDYGESIYYLKKSKDPVKKEIAKAVEELEKSLPSDVLESVFGDHCKVIATPKGFDVREFEHD